MSRWPRLRGLEKPCRRSWCADEPTNELEGSPLNQGLRRASEKGRLTRHLAKGDEIRRTRGGFGPESSSFRAALSTVSTEVGRASRASAFSISAEDHARTVQWSQRGLGRAPSRLAFWAARTEERTSLARVRVGGRSASRTSAYR